MYVNISYLCLANKHRVLKLLDWCAAQTSKLNNSASVIVRKPKFLCSVRRGLFYLLHFPRLSDENCFLYLWMNVIISYLCLANKHRVLKFLVRCAAQTSKLNNSASVIVRTHKFLCSVRRALFYLLHFPRLSDENCSRHLRMYVNISYLCLANKHRVLKLLDWCAAQTSKLNNSASVIVRKPKFLCSVRRGLFYLLHFPRLSDENCFLYLWMNVIISYLCLANKHRVLKFLVRCAAQTSKLNNSASVIVRTHKFLCSVRRALFYLLHFPRLSDENCSRHLRMYVNISYLCLANKHRVLKLLDWCAAQTSKLNNSASVIVRMLKLLCSLRGGLFYLIHIPRLSDENRFLYLWMNVIISYLCLANKHRVLKFLVRCAAQTSKLNNSASVIGRTHKFLCSVRRGLFYLLHFPRLSEENCSRYLRMYVNISYLCLANKHRVLKLWDWNAAQTSKLKSSASVIVRMLKLLCSLRGGLFYLIHIPRLSDENCFLYLWMNVIISYLCLANKHRVLKFLVRCVAQTSKLNNSASVIGRTHKFLCSVRRGLFYLLHFPRLSDENCFLYLWMYVTMSYLCLANKHRVLQFLVRCTAQTSK